MSRIDADAWLAEVIAGEATARPPLDLGSLDVAELATLERQLEASVCRHDFGAFVRHYWPVVTGVPLVPNAAIDELVTVLQRVADGELWRILIALPPGTGKSTVLALYAAWRLARDPSWRSIHGGHAFDLAATESRRVRRLVDSDDYKAMFPSVRIREDESTIALWATESNGMYAAVGRDTSVTGKRARELVLDDPMNATDRFSKAVRDATWVWLNEGLLSRFDGDRAPVIIVAQRLDRDDLIGRLIEAGGWHLVELPAERDDGTLLAPNVLPREKLEQLKHQIGAATYAAQFLQRPSDDANAAIKRSWWRFHHAPHVMPNAPRPTGCDTDTPAVPTPTRFDRVVIAVDMTFGGTKASNDFAAAQVWGSVGGARYLLEQWRRRATQLEQREAIRSLAKRYPGAKVVIEKAAGGHGTIEQLTADGIANIVGVQTGGKGKQERLGVVSPTIEGGCAFIPLGAAWLGDYVEELAGATRHDDAQDATAYAIAELNVGGLTAQQRWEAIAGHRPDKAPSGGVSLMHALQRASLLSRRRR